MINEEKCEKSLISQFNILKAPNIPHMMMSKGMIELLLDRYTAFHNGLMRIVNFHCANVGQVAFNDALDSLRAAFTSGIYPEAVIAFLIIEIDDLSNRLDGVIEADLLRYYRNYVLGTFREMFENAEDKC